MKLGTLEIVSASENPDLLAPPVRDFVLALGDGGGIGVAEIDPQFSDTAAFCEN